MLGVPVQKVHGFILRDEHTSAWYVIASATYIHVYSCWRHDQLHLGNGMMRPVAARM
jgi:hypothetical protein